MKETWEISPIRLAPISGPKESDGLHPPPLGLTSCSIHPFISTTPTAQKKSPPNSPSSTRLSADESRSRIDSRTCSAWFAICARTGRIDVSNNRILTLPVSICGKRIRPPQQSLHLAGRESSFKGTSKRRRLQKWETNSRSKLPLMKRSRHFSPLTLHGAGWPGSHTSTEIYAQIIKTRARSVRTPRH